MSRPNGDGYGGKVRGLQNMLLIVFINNHEKAIALENDILRRVARDEKARWHDPWGSTRARLLDSLNIYSFENEVLDVSLAIWMNLGSNVLDGEPNFETA